MSKIIFWLRPLGLTLFGISILLQHAFSQSNPGKYSADLIIYGGTSAAVTAAVEAVHSGKTSLPRDCIARFKESNSFFLCLFSYCILT